MPDADYRSQRCRTEFFAVYYYLHSRLLRRELHAASRRQLHRQRRLLALLHRKLLLEVGIARFLQHERMAANEQSLHNVWRDAILLAVNPNLGVHQVAVDRGRAVDGLRCELDCLRPTGNDFQLTARVAVARHRHHDVAQSLALTPRQRSAALAVAVDGHHCSLRSLHRYLGEAGGERHRHVGSLPVGERASGNLMLHYENSINNHDENHDGFYDKPRVEQYNAQSRWLWKGDRYIFHGGLSGLKEKRRGGQTGHGMATETPLFGIAVNTDRYEAYAKNAFIINPEHATNVALMASGSMHETDAVFGGKTYYVNEKNAYVSLMFETNFSERHNLSAGLSLNHDYFGQLYRLSHSATNATRDNEKETTPGVYAQYTLTLGKTLTAMAGIRADHSSVYGTFVTPRFHIKYAPSSLASFRLSAGKGYRTVHALAENNYLLASGRRLAVDPLKQEAAWNYGFSAALSIPIAGKALKVNAEYYYTHFSEQAVIDYDTDPSEIRITNLNGGKSFSHTMQVDATYPFFQGFSVTAAYRLNDVRTTFGGTLREKPLTSRYKALLTASYKTALDLWQFDATLQINGGGRMPEPYTLGDGSLSWQRRFNAYPQLSAQVTRWFRHWSIYVGGENLTNFKQKTPIIAASDPWSERFDPTMVWGPVHGWMLYAGVRINFGKL